MTPSWLWREKMLTTEYENSLNPPHLLHPGLYPELPPRLSRRGRIETAEQYFGFYPVVKESLPQIKAWLQGKLPGLEVEFHFITSRFNPPYLLIFVDAGLALDQEEQMRRELSDAFPFLYESDFTIDAEFHHWSTRYGQKNAPYNCP